MRTGTCGVTPCVGVWIEIHKIRREYYYFCVTPCVGVWIEIVASIGLTIAQNRHSLRGSVD